VPSGSVVSVPVIPTYVSQYPASRVTSACSCLIGATSTALAVSTAATVIFDPYRASCASFTLSITSFGTSLFNGPILADKRDIYTPSAGAYHTCNDGSGVTPITLIDAAAKHAGFAYDGTWDNIYQDYTLTLIDGYTVTGQQKWGFSVNSGLYSTSGGCETLLQPGDIVSWAVLDFILVLTAPATVQAGSAFSFIVSTATGTISLAGITVTLLMSSIVATTTTDANGQGSFFITDPGTYTIVVTPPPNYSAGTTTIMVTGGPS
jgi:hypothetical protein